MEFQKIVNLLDTTSVKNLPLFVVIKWIEVYDQSERNYNVNKQVRIKISVLRAYLCNYSDAYIAVERTITAVKKEFVANYFVDLAKHTRAAAADTTNDAAIDGRLAFKNNGPLISCISKINGVLINNPEDLDVLMPMYNLVE